MLAMVKVKGEKKRERVEVRLRLKLKSSWPVWSADLTKLHS